MYKKEFVTLIIAIGVFTILGSTLQAQDRSNNSDEEWEKYGMEYRHFRFAIIPGLSTNGIDATNYASKFSLNILAGYNGALTNSGFEFGSILNANKYYAHGVQVAGLANYSGEETAGIQLAGIGTYSRDSMQGIQLSGVGNWAAEDMQGIQFSGVFNLSGGNSQGLQAAGVLNASRGDMQGLFSAGVGNIANGDMQGLLFSGVFNIAQGDMQGIVSSGVLNYSEYFQGIALSSINVSKEFQGIQLGTINVTEEGQVSRPALLTMQIDLKACPLDSLAIMAMGGKIWIRGQAKPDLQILALSLELMKFII